MWKTVPWSEIKPGQPVKHCAVSATDSRPNMTTPPNPGYNYQSQCALKGSDGEHTHCIAWFEPEAFKPRVVVEFKDGGEDYRLVETAPGVVWQESKVTETDSLNVTTTYWQKDVKVDDVCQLALVALVPRVGEK